MHGGVRSAPWSCQFHSARQSEVQLDLAEHPVPRRPALSRDRRPRRHSDRDGRPAGDPERRRFRDDDDGSRQRAAFLVDKRRHRRVKPYLTACDRRAATRWLRHYPFALRVRLRCRPRHPVARRSPRRGSRPRSRWRRVRSGAVTLSANPVGLPPDPILSSMLSTPSPRVSEAEANEIARRHYDLETSAKRLASERDEMFRLRDAKGIEYLLKITNPAEPPDVTHLQTAALHWIA